MTQLCAAALAAILIGVWNQGPETPAPATTATNLEPRPEAYEVGPGDVLDVTVLGHPELSRTAPVLSSGAISLPLLREVSVQGLTVLEIQRRLANLLERDYVRQAQVEVTVASYQSAHAIVTGEVNAPGRKLLRGRTRLIDLVVDAGGLTPSASGEVLITRTLASGSQEVIEFRLGSSGILTAREREALEFPIRDGDFVALPTRRLVSVEGEVLRPGRYPLEHSLRAVLAAAGGTTRFASSKITVRRTAQDGQTQVIELNLKAIQRGQQPDFTLAGNDFILVERKRF